MTKAEVVIRFSVGATILLLVCAGITSLAIISHAMIEPSAVQHPPRVCPPSELKQAIDELKYGPVNRTKQNEIKDGFLGRFRARMQSRQFANAQPQCQAAPIQQPNATSAFCPPTTFASATIHKTSDVTKAVEYPSNEYQTNPIALPNIRVPSICPTCPIAEIKTGAFICSHCRQPKVGEDWHTDWMEDGKPLTYLCRHCNSSLNASQKQAVYQSYMRTQSSAVAGAFEPEVSR